MAFRSISTPPSFSGNNSGAPYADKPSGVVADDILILMLAMDGTGASITAWPSGFTEIMNVTQGSPDGRTSAAAWKRAGGSEPSTYTITMSGSVGADTHCSCAAFSGRDTGNPPTWGTVTNQGVAVSNGASIPASGVTASAGDDLAWIVMVDATGFATASFTPPSGYTERLDTYPDFAGLTIATQDNVSAGATGTVNGTIALTSGTAGYDSVLVRIPASTGTSAYPVNIITSRQGAAFASARNRF